MAKYLLENIYFPNNKENHWCETPAIYGCKYKSNYNLQIFKLLLKYNCSLNQTGTNVWFPLYAACRSNNKLILKYMIKNKLRLNTINLRGDSTYHSTPLMAVIALNNVECVDSVCDSDAVDKMD